MRKLHEVKSVQSAKNFEIGDKIVYTFGKQEIKGEIADHFGDGVLVLLKGYLYFDDHSSKNANPQGYNTWTKKIKSFEIFDGEDTPYGSFDNIKKI